MLLANCAIYLVIEKEVFSLCIITYLNGVKRDIVHVVDHAQQTVRESNKGSTQQEDEVMLIQTHLSRTITAENKLSQSDFG